MTYYAQQTEASQTPLTCQSAVQEFLRKQSIFDFKDTREFARKSQIMCDHN